MADENNDRGNSLLLLLLLGGGVALAIFLASQKASASEGAAAAGAGAGYPAPPADSAWNPEVGDAVSGSTGLPVTDEKVILLATAIATAEGFYNPDPNVIPRRAHNPGDLTTSFGLPTAGKVNAEGVLAFNNDDDGWTAIKTQARMMLEGTSRIYSPLMTLRQVAAHYTTRDGIPTPESNNWALNAAQVLGITRDQTLADFLAL